MLNEVDFLEFKAIKAIRIYIFILLEVFISENLPKLKEFPLFIELNQQFLE